jgi:hypothetical protein
MQGALKTRKGAKEGIILGTILVKFADFQTELCKK